MTAFTLLMALTATVCAVWAVIVYRAESLKWRRFVAAVGSEEGAITATLLLEAEKGEQK